MTTIDIQECGNSKIRLGITEPPYKLLLEEKNIGISSFPVTILFPKNIKIIIPYEPQKDDFFYNIFLSISLPEDLALVINAQQIDNRNPTGTVIERSGDIQMGVTGLPFSFHMKEKKYLDFFAPRDGQGKRHYSGSRFWFLEMMEEYNSLSQF
jgi:hypothetical protein